MYERLLDDYEMFGITRVSQDVVLVYEVVQQSRTESHSRQRPEPATSRHLHPHQRKPGCGAP